jgi:prepilin-type N-terminal cleavage/methylation domain-containing protein
MKKAFSLIELIFAIVIISFTLLSIPLVLQTSARLDEFSITQESIFAATSKMKEILSFRWDENALQNGQVRVLDVAEDIYKRDPLIEGNRSRSGHYPYIKRRSFFNSYTTPTGIKDGYDDIDDFDAEQFILQGSADAKDDYKLPMELNATVLYVQDSDGIFHTNSHPTQTNLKMIQITDGLFVLRAYSANIGERELLQRVFP